MTTKHRRITISLPPDLDAAVTDLADAQGTPHSKVIINIMTDFIPTMNGLATMMRQIKAGQTSEAKLTMTQTFGDTLGKMMALELDGKGKKK